MFCESGTICFAVYTFCGIAVNDRKEKNKRMIILSSFLLAFIRSIIIYLYVDTSFYFAV